jgi:hypothetical protein
MEQNPALKKKILQHFIGWKLIQPKQEAKKVKK